MRRTALKALNALHTTLSLKGYSSGVLQWWCSSLFYKMLVKGHLTTFSVYSSLATTIIVSFGMSVRRCPAPSLGYSFYLRTALSNDVSTGTSHAVLFSVFFPKRVLTFKFGIVTASEGSLSGGNAHPSAPRTSGLLLTQERSCVYGLRDLHAISS